MAKNLLVVDDDAELRETIFGALESRSLNITLAENGSKALELITAQAGFHLVLSDIKMADMSGLELLSKARSSQITSPFVFLVGVSDHEDVIRAIRLGATDFVHKPFEPEELMDVVDRTLELEAAQSDLHKEILCLPKERLERVYQIEKKIESIRAGHPAKKPA